MASEDFYPSITPVTLNCEYSLELVHLTADLATQRFQASEQS